MEIPSDPPDGIKEPKTVSPVTFLNPERYRPAVPDGTVHPSQNRQHVMHGFTGDQEVLVIPSDIPLEDFEEEPTDSDLDPLLVDIDPNALKGNLSDE